MWVTVLVAAVAGLGEPEAGAPAPTSQPAPEPAAFFQQLAERYRNLSSYSDESAVVEVVTRAGAEPHRVEGRLFCRLEGDTLIVETPGDQLRHGLAPGPRPALSPAMETLVRRYNLWLAPHMALHFAVEPLRELRLGVPQGFVAASSEVIPSGDGTSSVRLDLRSAEAPSAPSETPAAVFSLWVDADSMLVTRIGGRQKLPDGADYEVTLEITPRSAVPESKPAA